MLRREERVSSFRADSNKAAIVDSVAAYAEIPSLQDEILDLLKDAGIESAEQLYELDIPNHNVLKKFLQQDIARYIGIW